jgi:hypothetical protein
LLAHLEASLPTWKLQSKSRGHGSRPNQTGNSMENSLTANGREYTRRDGERQTRL